MNEKSKNLHDVKNLEIIRDNITMESSSMKTLWRGLNKREVGAFCPISSLPSQQGIGCFGTCAYRWVDFLKQAGMHYWQMCPLNPTSYGDSPYQSPSSFACNPYFIDIERCIKEGLLLEDECKGLRDLPHDHVDYGKLYNLFYPLMEQAFHRFLNCPQQVASCHQYYEKSKYWLKDYSYFMALKDAHNGEPWWLWSKLYRTPGAPMDRYHQRAYFYQFLQWQCDQDLHALKNYAHSSGIRLIGDVPIFVGRDSADVWAHPEWFKLRKDGSPYVVAGVPPDAFSETGQLWGNPVYHWGRLKADHFRWWRCRIARNFELSDIIRWDHFRGFDRTWEVPYPAQDARRGQWRASGGRAFLEAIQKDFPDKDWIAEDLGVLDEKSRALLHYSGLPGMEVLQFAFDGSPDNPYLPHAHGKNKVLYLGTHDNNTTRGWYEHLSPESQQQVKEYFWVDGKDIVWDLIKRAYGSVSRLLILNLTDLLNCGEEARLNHPSEPCGHWRWRCSPEAFHGLLDGDVAPYLRSLAKRYGRL